MESQIHNLLAALLLAVMLALAAYYMMRQNQNLSSLAEEAPEDFHQDLAQALKMRTIQLLALGGIASILLVALSAKYTTTHDMLLQLTQAIEKRQLMQQQEKAASPPVATPSAQAAPQPAPLAAVTVTAVQPALVATPTAQQEIAEIEESTASPVTLTPIDEESESEITETAEPSTQTDETSNEIQAKSVPSPIEQLYNPEKSQAEKNPDAKMDDIKRRYEDILVLHMFMKKCNKTQPTDYNVITSALAQEMANINAPGKMHTAILTAAQGTFKEIYADSPCQGNGVGALSKQYAKYIKTLQSGFSPE